MSEVFDAIIPFLNTEFGVFYFVLFMYQNTKLFYRFYFESNFELRFDFFED